MLATMRLSRLGCHCGAQITTLLYRTCGSNTPGIHGFVRQTWSTQTVQQMERDLNRLISKQLKAKHTKGPVEEQALQQKLRMLESLGCSMEQVEDCPEILAMEVEDYVALSKKLQSVDCQTVTVQLLKIAQISLNRSLKNNVTNHLELVQGNDSKMNFIAEKLQCTVIEMYHLKRKVSFFKSIQDLKLFSQKVDLLIDNGATLENIKAHPYVLRKSLKTLEDRISEIVNLGHDIELPLSVLAQGTKAFKRWISNYSREQNALGEHKNKYELVASLLNVDISDVHQLEYIERISPSLLHARILFLLDIGIKQAEIFNFDYMLRWSQATMERAVVEAKEAGYKTVTLWNLINLVHHKTLSKRKFSARKVTYLSSLLQISKDHLLSMNLQCVWSTDKVQIRYNLEFLMSKGFSLEHIRQCAVLLGHNNDVLVQYYNSLWNREELEPFEELFNDKMKMLNVLQYFIERERNFSNVIAVDGTDNFMLNEDIASENETGY